MPDDRLLDEARARVEAIACHSQVILKVGKKALNEIGAMTLKEGYEHERTYTTGISGHADSRAAIGALVERRSPDYGKPE